MQNNSGVPFGLRKYGRKFSVFETGAANALTTNRTNPLVLLVLSTVVGFNGFPCVSSYNFLPRKPIVKELEDTSFNQGALWGFSLVPQSATLYPASIKVIHRIKTVNCKESKKTESGILDF